MLHVQLGPTWSNSEPLQGQTALWPVLLAFCQCNVPGLAMATAGGTLKMDITWGDQRNMGIRYANQQSY